MADRPIIDWPAWTVSPPGRYVLDWEQSQLDQVVSNIFGYHALQLGMPQLDALRENRMPYRGLVLDAALGTSAPFALPGATMQASGASAQDSRQKSAVAPSSPAGRSTIWCDFLELPFDAQSVDLLVLPHTLEFTPNPHGLLREAERVLMPEGQLVILGFNSLSLWGVRQTVSRMTGSQFVPAAHDLIAFNRIKDWIKLLGFELDRGRFGCYRPPLLTDKWLARCAFMEAAGDRWWPIFGASYMITAIKRVTGMRLIGKAWATKPALAPALAPVATPHASTEFSIANVSAREFINTARSEPAK
ncbi:methyltransferase domain-containing protein [Burkholderia sp. L27(2015)]|uniref:methyltransferase domain-containing protein n=1 Tax=Burkholderia sp. L27(2015) TaxID=1641858 RepID=UPI00131BDAC9|nr:methyltransferase domain-containing protein [Burkholderia sp. L27(2015)]